jgi:hypothetical protein
MKQKINRPVRSTVSQVIAMCAILTLLAGTVFGGLVLWDALIRGQTYAPSVVFGDSRMIYRNSSPDVYWRYMSFYLLSAAVMPIISIIGLREVVIEQIRKNAATALQGNSSRKDNLVLIMSALAYLVILLVIGNIIAQAMKVEGILK